MTVSAQTPINRSTGNGVTTVFPYTFKIIAAGDIEVSVDDVVKTLNVDYTVSGAGVDAGGNVTMTVAPASLTTVVRRRNMAFTRSTDYQDQGALPAATLDNDIDAPVLMIQQLDERLDRTFSLPVSSSASSAMPAPTAGYVLGWDALGENLVNLPGQVGSSLIDLAASSGASMVGYVPFGVGGAPTDVQSQLRNIGESVSDIATLRAKSFPDGSLITVAGYYASNDVPKHLRIVSSVDDGSGILMANGLYANLNMGTQVHVGWFGAKSNSAGIFETENTAYINAAFAYVRNITGAELILDGRYYTNGELIFPLCDLHTVYQIGLQTIKGNNSIILSSHGGTALRIKTGASIATRNYALLMQDFYVQNLAVGKVGTGIHVEGAFSPTYRRLIVSNYDVCIDNYCSSEINFDNVICHTCNIGVRGNQLSNPNGVTGNDFSVMIINKLVVFGFEQYGFYSNGGGIARFTGGTMAAPGHAALAAIRYEGEFRDVSISDVCFETQNALSDGVIAFKGSGLKRSIKISGVTQEVIGVTNPSTLIVAEDVENITIENVPFSVQASTIAAIRYVMIDGAKQVTFRSNALSSAYLNKVDLYDVEEVIVDNYQLKGPNVNVRMQDSTGSPIGLIVETFVAGGNTDFMGRTGINCAAARISLLSPEMNAILATKKPFVGAATVLCASTTLTTMLRYGNTNMGQYTSPGIIGRWKTQLFSYPTAGLADSSVSQNGIRYSGISGVSQIGLLFNDDTYQPKLLADAAGIAAGFINVPQFTTFYNVSATLGDPAGWVSSSVGYRPF